MRDCVGCDVVQGPERSPTARNSVQPLGDDSCLAPRKRGPHSCKEVNFANNLNVFGSDFFPP